MTFDRACAQAAGAVDFPRAQVGSCYVNVQCTLRQGSLAASGSQRLDDGALPSPLPVVVPSPLSVVVPSPLSVVVKLTDTRFNVVRSAIIGASGDHELIC